ncbi:lysine acetyltransferase protein [Diplodia corticola]|uniref:Lysine acetyltransferase protein n=1 Tax=Diplodia corticola TaxID=236234 RepID=A0A1J9QPP4_9PEZI|nr:lysine acetyltransferase protein [Diplodia corticola]OJD30433.1 lysine acetyltransferase protein [Diplodia corticola]
MPLTKQTMDFVVDGLPESTSPNLHLSHPTPEECVQISTKTSASWKDSLTLPVYLEESKYLATVPLAKNNGLTMWILVDKNLPQNERPILCSCESFRKRSLTSDADGNVEDNMVHGIASVYCPPEYRGRGYGTRHMKEMAKVLYSWQSEQVKCVGSVLYSDIGKTYYANLGWKPNPTNSHVLFQPAKIAKRRIAKEIMEGDLAELCDRDEKMVRKIMATPAKAKRRLTIVPDLDHMLWHIGKEDFATQFLFGKIAQAKGAIAGPPGRQVWAIWTHRYYNHPDAESPDNVLYILRLVVEGQDSHAEIFEEQVDYLTAVLQTAQAEATDWRLNCVNLWNPTPLVRSMIAQSGIEYSMVEREDDSIASGLWYDENGGVGPAPEWLNNEHYAWC